MKILFINTLYYPNMAGGAERSVQQLAEKMLEHGHEPVIVCTAKQDKIDEVNGIKVYYVNFRNLYWGNESKDKPFAKKLLWHSKDVYNWSMKKKFHQIVADEKPDIVHSNNLSGFSVVPWLVAKETNIPVVHTLRDYYLLCPQSGMYREGSNCERRCTSCRVLSEYKKTLTNRRYVDHVVGISQFIVDRHKQYGYFRDVPYSKIFNGMSANPLVNEQRAREGELTFLYIGRFDTTKGVHSLLDTFAQLDNVNLWLGGKVHDPLIKRNIEQNVYPSNIQFLGYVNPDEVLPQVDALIIPSLWHEPFGRVIFEAYRHNVPVIGTNRGGIPELIAHGQTGYIYDPDQEGALQSLLLSLRDQPHKLRDLRCASHPIYEHNTLEVTAQHYIQIYEEVRNSLSSSTLYTS